MNCRNDTTNQTNENYLWDPAARPDADIARMEASLSALRDRGNVRIRSSRGPRIGVLAIVALVALTAAIMNLGLPFGAGSLPIYGVEGLSHLRAGEWIQPTSEARIDLDDMGEVTIDPDARLRLLKATPREHRLELARGRIEAFVTAPPRMFFVQTPSALAIDLGCAYTLDVDDDGAGVLQVTLGWVALEKDGRTSTVPAGASCQMSPEYGPGTPIFDDAPEDFRAAMTQIDHGDPSPAALEKALQTARPRDSLTLYHLLPTLDGPQREATCDRLTTLVPMPDRVTREGVLALNDGQMYRWWNAIQGEW